MTDRRDDKPRRGGRDARRGPGERNGPRPGRRERAETREAGSAAEAAAEPGERIAKRLARAGIASRRDAETLIAAGRIRLNGKVLASPAVNVIPSDVIELDGTQIPAIERTRLFLFHKPAGVVTTNRDPQGRRTVFDALPGDLPRLVTVGRLDINTEGLLLLTNDGGLARVLELPATGWLRRYRVRVHGAPDEKALAELRHGIAVDGVFYGAVEAALDRTQGSNAWLTIGLREGKNREVKNILRALGLEVARLIRVSYGPFQLGELPEGNVQEIRGRTLRDQLGERLIAEAGANFEAELARPFSNKPTARGDGRSERPPRRESQGAAPRAALRVGEGGLVKSRKREREARRETALERLSTRPEGGARKPARGAQGPREERRDEPRRPRTSNVWMAPGARPQGKGAERSAPAPGKAAKAAPRPGKGHGKPGRPDRPDRPGKPKGKPSGPRPGGDRRPRGGRRDADRRR
jgi:23S rRNA pseudouridine2605 synthase